MVDKLKLTRYSSNYQMPHGDCLKVGGGTQVTIHEVTRDEVFNIVPKDKQTPGEKRYRFHVDLTLTVDLNCAQGKCAICGRLSSPPDADAAYFMIMNHNGDRFMWAEEENVEPERDRYPVAGWTKTQEGLTCYTCYKDLEEARLQVIQRNRGKTP